MAEVAEKAPEKKMQFPARLHYARISPRKMRYVVDLIRGKDFNSAITILRHCSKRGAPFCKKLIESAYANAMDTARSMNLDIDGDALHLVEARVDAGPIIKRWRPSSARRPQAIQKKTAHLTFILEERELKVSKAEKTRQKKQEQQRAASAAKKAAKAKKADTKKAEAKKDAPAPETKTEDKE
ncbi:MAG: 50S ribosomal protein L22 [Planctomycetota bacterium]|jgi:large subunit ribosomal protein L22|nr:50S ribosomal protein L22 [Planctomycetota bacterium]